MTDRRHIVAGLVVSLSVAFAAMPAIAQSQPGSPPDQQSLELGQGVICDTEQQAHLYVSVFKGDVDQALASVNRDAGSKKACGVAVVAYKREADVADVSADGGPYKISKITVLAALLPDGFSSVPPFQQFAVFKLPGLSV